MRVKCLAQEHNTMSPARARTRSAHSGVKRANHEATVPPTLFYKDGENLFITLLYIFKCLKINYVRCDNTFVVIFFKAMYNKTIIRFGFCDIRNNQGLG